MSPNYWPQCHRHWPIEQRLAHYSKGDLVSGCLVWHGSVNEWGYGRISVKGRKYLAHRLAWIAKHGPIPGGLSVCHRCDERRCVNPDHLFLGAHATNMADRRRKRQRWYGAANKPDRGLLCDTSAPDLAPIRILYRGIEFRGQAVARVVDPAAWSSATSASAAKPAPVRARSPQARRSRDARSARRSGGRP
jgi:hypothetical protein